MYYTLKVLYSITYKKQTFTEYLFSIYIKSIQNS